jgi:hypothetical protein
MARSQRWVGLVGAVLLLAALVPTKPAFACSCAEPTIPEISAREAEAVVARIRRVDDGGSQGIGRVLEVLHGPQLPAEVPLDLDTGASCLPWVAVGEVAVLAFVPDGNGWRTLECGMLDPTTGLEPVLADPAAVGAAALVVFGQLPEAELVALDDHLRVLSVAHSPIHPQRVEPCDEGLLVLGHDEHGRGVAALLELPSFQQVAHYLPVDDPDVGSEQRDASCRPDGRVDLLVQTWAGQSELHRDVFGDPVTSTLPRAESGAFVGEQIALLQPATGGEGPLTLTLLDPATGDSSLVLEHRATGYEIIVAPDARNALVRGDDDGPLLLVIELSSGRVVAETQGWWQPTQRPWLRADRILLMDEDSGGMTDTGVPRYQLVDLSLREVAPLPPIVTRTVAAAEGSAVVATSEGLTVLDAEAQPVRTLDEPWPAGASGALPLHPIVADPDAHITPTLESTRQVTETATDHPTGGAPDPARWLLPAAVLTMFGAALLNRRSGVRGR